MITDTNRKHQRTVKMPSIEKKLKTASSSSGEKNPFNRRSITFGEEHKRQRHSLIFFSTTMMSLKPLCMALTRLKLWMNEEKNSTKKIPQLLSALRLWTLFSVNEGMKIKTQLGKTCKPKNFLCRIKSLNISKTSQQIVLIPYMSDYLYHL